MKLTKNQSLSDICRYMSRIDIYFDRRVVRTPLHMYAPRCYTNSDEAVVSHTRKRRREETKRIIRCICIDSVVPNALLYMYRARSLLCVNIAATLRSLDSYTLRLSRFLETNREAKRHLRLSVCFIRAYAVCIFLRSLFTMFKKTVKGN